MSKIAIIGLGLMGGSLGLAARARGMYVSAYARREDSRRDALAMGIADVVFDCAADAVQDADIVVLCTPVLTMVELVHGFVNNLKDGCIVTDVGSTKGFLAEEIGAVLADSAAEFIGSHPMAGSEKNGIEASASDLYQGARVIVTPADGTKSEKTKRVVDFWKDMGANVTEMTPEAHDDIIARTSHLPHLVAASLMACVDRDDSDIAPFCGPGIRDVTRISEGSEEIWHDIVKSNCDAVLSEINVFSDQLAEVKKMLKRKDFDAIKKFLAVSRDKREKLGL
jgi:prephenate dehydrogenase